MTKTHMVIQTNKTPMSSDQKSLMELRAARFKMATSGSSNVPPVNKPASASTSTDPAEAERLAARAARFADVKSVPAISTTGKVSLSAGGSSSQSSPASSVEDAEKLAKRAARFANIPK